MKIYSTTAEACAGTSSHSWSISRVSTFSTYDSGNPVSTLTADGDVSGTATEESTIPTETTTTFSTTTVATSTNSLFTNESQADEGSFTTNQSQTLEATTRTDISTATTTSGSTRTDTDTTTYSYTVTTEATSTNSLFTSESQEYPSSSTTYTTSTTYSDISYDTVYGPTDFTVYFSQLSTTEYESSSTLSASSGITRTIGSNVTVSWSTSTQSSSYFSTSWLTMVYSIVPPFPYYVTSSTSSTETTYFDSESSSSTYTTTSDAWTYTTTSRETIISDTTVTVTITEPDTITLSTNYLYSEESTFSSTQITVTASTGHSITIGSNSTSSFTSFTSFSAYYYSSERTSTYINTTSFVSSASATHTTTYRTSDSWSDSATGTTDDWTYTTTRSTTESETTDTTLTETITVTTTTTSSASTTTQNAPSASQSQDGATTVILESSLQSGFSGTTISTYGATRSYYESSSSSLSISWINSPLSFTLTVSGTNIGDKGQTVIESFTESIESVYSAVFGSLTQRTWGTYRTSFSFSQTQGLTAWSGVETDTTQSMSDSGSTYTVIPAPSTSTQSGSTTLSHSFVLNVSSTSRTISAISSTSTTVTSTSYYPKGITFTSVSGGITKTITSTTYSTTQFDQTTSSTQTTTVSTWTFGGSSSFFESEGALTVGLIFEREPGERMFSLKGGYESLTSSLSDSWFPLSFVLTETTKCTFIPTCASGTSTSDSSSSEFIYTDGRSESYTSSSGTTDSAFEILALSVGAAGFTISTPTSNTKPYFGAYGMAATTVSLERGLFDITSQSLTTNTSTSSNSTLESSVTDSLSTFTLSNANLRLHTRSTISFSSENSSSSNYPDYASTGDTGARLMGIFTWNTTSLAT